MNRACCSRSSSGAGGSDCYTCPGGVPERPNGTASKAVRARKGSRAFKSHRLRSSYPGPPVRRAAARLQSVHRRHAGAAERARLESAWAGEPASKVQILLPPQILPPTCASVTRGHAPAHPSSVRGRRPLFGSAFRLLSLRRSAETVSQHQARLARTVSLRHFSRTGLWARGHQATAQT